MSGTAPVTPVLKSMGVSMTPNGLSDAPLRRFSLTVIGPGELTAPLNDNVTAPVTVPDDGRLGVNTTAIERVADPVPDGGLTCSHG